MNGKHCNCNVAKRLREIDRKYAALRKKAYLQGGHAPLYVESCLAMEKRLAVTQ